MKTILKKISSLILSVILVCSILPARVNANFEIPRNYQLQADANEVCTVKILDYYYDNNTYLSLRDIAMALKDTDKSFSLQITRNSVSLNMGSAYTPAGGENVPWEDGKNPDITLRRNDFVINGQEAAYYTMIMRMPSGVYDCFIMTADLAMILDVDIAAPEAGSLQIDTQKPFRISPVLLEEAGYFNKVNSMLMGDATTGEIYYQYEADRQYPIASTSKLMTCLLAMEAISTGQVAPEDLVTVSDKVELLGASEDGIIPLKAGEQIMVQDLLLGTLLPSSNECALCLAEAIAGSEEAFVERMNQKAQELGLSQAVFFNSNGLPVYTKDPVASKHQNSMSAEDMFLLASYLLKVYPQITEITSLKEATLTYLDTEVKNSNYLLYNLPEATGLKTGSTNKAGSCLITSLKVNDGAEEHDLVVVVLGTEDSRERCRVSELLARYALDTFYTGIEEEAENGAAASPNLPTHAEAAVERILQTAKKHRD